MSRPKCAARTRARAAVRAAKQFSLAQELADSARVPEPQLPSDQGPNAQLVDPELDVVTIAIQVPETIGHLHAWSVEMTRRFHRAGHIIGAASLEVASRDRTILFSGDLGRFGDAGRGACSEGGRR